MSVGAGFYKGFLKNPQLSRILLAELFFYRGKLAADVDTAVAAKHFFILISGACACGWEKKIRSSPAAWSSFASFSRCRSATWILAETRCATRCLSSRSDHRTESFVAFAVGKLAPRMSATVGAI